MERVTFLLTARSIHGNILLNVRSMQGGFAPRRGRRDPTPSNLEPKKSSPATAVDRARRPE